MSLENRKYIRWDAEGVEKLQPNEAEDIQAVADQINAIQRAMYNSHRHCFGGAQQPPVRLIQYESMTAERL